MTSQENENKLQTLSSSTEFGSTNVFVTLFRLRVRVHQTFVLKNDSLVQFYNSLPLTQFSEEFPVRSRTLNMEDESWSDVEEKILYDLTVHAEWPQEPEITVSFLK